MPVSPKGKLEWPHLFVPQKKFENQLPHGEYKVELILPKDDAKSMQKLLKEMDDAHFKKTADKALEKFRESKNGEKDNFKDGLEFAKKKGMERKPIPGSPVKDENLEETGEIKFTFREDAVWENKEKTWRKEWKINVRNAKNKTWDMTKEIGNGSLGKVAYEIQTHDMPHIGVRLKLRGVQVLDWIEYQKSGDSSPFQEEEGEDINAEEAIEEAEELFKEEADVPY